MAPFLVLPLYSRVLSTYEFGILSIALSVSQFSFFITDFGFSVLATNLIAKYRGFHSKISAVFSGVFLVKLILIGPLFIFLLSIMYFLDLRFEIQILVSALVLVQSFFPVWYFYGIEKSLNLTIATFISKGMYVLIVFLSLGLGLTVERILTILLATSVLGSFYGVIAYLVDGHRLRLVPIRYLRILVYRALNFFVARTVVGFYTVATPAIVGLLAGPIAAGKYYLIDQLFKGGQSLTAPLLQGMLPYMSTGMGYGRRKIFFLLMFSCVAFMCVGGVVFYFISEYLMLLFFGEKFSSISDIVVFLPILVIANFLARCVGYPLFASVGAPEKASRSIYIAFVLYIVILGLIYLSSNFSILNIVLLLIVIELFVFFHRFFYFIKIYLNY